MPPGPAHRPASSRATRRYFLRVLGAGLAVPALSPALPHLALAAPGAPATPTPAPSPTSAPSPTPAAPIRTPTPPPTSSPTWLQALRPVPLWSGPDDDAEQLGVAARWDYFQLARSQDGSRLLVLVARTQNYAWVDALSVGPSGPPPPGWPPADLPPPPDDLSIGWVAAVVDAPLWADPDSSLLLGTAPAWTAFKQLEPQSGPRLRVQDPYSGAESWLDAVNAGPIDPPSRIDVPGRWWGIAFIDGANLRPEPSTRTTALGALPGGRPIVVSGWVAGEEVIKDNPTWAQLSDGAYLYSSVLRPVALPAAPPPPATASSLSGRWIDLNLSQQVVVAYEGQVAVRVARTSTGRPGWETPPAFYTVQRRVEKETMASTSLIGLDARRADYTVENVRWTQYFSADGKALHENYWKPRDQFGIPSSHGCAGLVAEDARFFWDWASLGTPIFCHY